MSPTPPPDKQSKPAKKKSSENTLLLAAIDDLLGLHSDVEVVLKNDKKQQRFTQEEKDVLRHYEEGLQKTLDIIAPAGMEVLSDTVQINDLLARTLYVYNWPNYIYPNWLSTLINYDAEMEVTEFIYPSSNRIIMKMLRKKVTELRASIRMLEQRGIVRDPTLEAALQDAEELRDLLARGREKLFQFGMYITIYAEDKDKLKKLQTDVESIMGGKLVLTKPAMFQMEHAWVSTLPLCLDELEINRNMNTSPLGTAFPFSSSDLTDDHGILYGINRHNDSLVIFDRFDLANANSTVFATSGAGKSFTVKLELLRSLMLNTEVYVLDPENEYVDLSKAVGGSYIPVSLQSSNSINPFDLPRAVRGDEARTGETLRAAIINLHGLFKLMLGTLTPAEDGVLDKAILDTYALKGITLETEDPEGLEPPTMHELVDVLATTHGGEHMAQTLSKYTDGSYAGIFDKQTNVELDSQMVVFQIRDLEEQLRPIAMYIILNFLWNRVRSTLKRRLLVIDEAWNLMQYEDSARFLYGLIKRARKYYLGVTTITQDVEDFVNSPYGKPIITNSSFQVLLKQSASAVDNLQKLFYLTDGEKYLLLNSSVGQGLFFAGNKHVAIQIVASPQEERLITTKPDEVLKRQEKEKDAKAAEQLEEDIQTTNQAVDDTGAEPAADADSSPEPTGEQSTAQSDDITQVDEVDATTAEPATETEPPEEISAAQEEPATAQADPETADADQEITPASDDTETAVSDEEAVTATDDAESAAPPDGNDLVETKATDEPELPNQRLMDIVASMKDEGGDFQQRVKAKMHGYSDIPRDNLDDENTDNESAEDDTKKSDDEPDEEEDNPYLSMGAESS